MARRSASIVRYVTPGYAPRAAPITIRMPRAPSAPKKHHRRRGRRGYGGSGTGRMFGFAIGGAAVGLFEKSDFAKDLPSLPVIGKKGTIALGAYFWATKGGGQLAWDIAAAGAVLAGYQLGKEGKIEGDDEF